jgi:hypothetical protein
MALLAAVMLARALRPNSFVRVQWFRLNVEAARGRSAGAGEVLDACEDAPPRAEVGELAPAEPAGPGASWRPEVHWRPPGRAPRHRDRARLCLAASMPSHEIVAAYRRELAELPDEDAGDVAEV